MGNPGAGDPNWGMAHKVAISLLFLLLIAISPLSVPITSVAAGGVTLNANTSAIARTDIPQDYLLLYQAAGATCSGLDWSVLAGIGKIESNHGRSSLPGVHSGSNSAGAQGPMQFLPATFAEYNHPISPDKQPTPAGGASPSSPYNPTDAIYAAARMLCRDGAFKGRDLHGAIFCYNHSEAYIKKVLEQADRYRVTPAVPAPPSPKK